MFKVGDLVMYTDRTHAHLRYGEVYRVAGVSNSNFCAVETLDGSPFDGPSGLFAVMAFNKDFTTSFPPIAQPPPRGFAAYMPKDYKGPSLPEGTTLVTPDCSHLSFIEKPLFTGTYRACTSCGKDLGDAKQ